MPLPGTEPANPMRMCWTVMCAGTGFGATGMVPGAAPVAASGMVPPEGAADVAGGAVDAVVSGAVSLDFLPPAQPARASEATRIQAVRFRAMGFLIDG